MCIKAQSKKARQTLFFIWIVKFQSIDVIAFLYVTTSLIGPNCRETALLGRQQLQEMQSKPLNFWGLHIDSSAIYKIM